MDTKLSIVSLILSLTLIASYVTREFTASQYIDRINEIKSVKDSLDSKVKYIEMEIIKRDNLLIKSINQSKSIIKEFESRINVSNTKYQEYDSISGVIINELIELSIN